jgi:hypothetical protein
MVHDDDRIHNPLCKVEPLGWQLDIDELVDMYIHTRKNQLTVVDFSQYVHPILTALYYNNNDCTSI